MAALPITEDEVARIVAAAKSIKGDLAWRYAPHQGFAKAELRIVSDLGLDLKVAATANLRIPGRFSFSLIAKGAFSIRRLDSQKYHQNRHTDRRLIAGSHLHVWTNNCRERWAIVSPFPVTDDVKNGFRDFCDECKIVFDGVVQDLPMFQGELKI